MTAPPTHRPGKRGVLLLTIFAVLCVVMPFLVWHETWFGRRLSDKDLDTYLADGATGRRTQHALVQLSERMAALDPAARRWYPGLLRAAGSPDPAVRNVAAWVMSFDPRSDLLRERLRSLLSDPDVQVRRNAALSLVRFGDASGREELAAILRPHEVRTANGGAVELLVEVGQEVGAGTKIAVVRRSGAAGEHVTSPFHSRVAVVFAANGSHLEPGSPLVGLAPRAQDVWEALRGLYFVGDADDLPAVDRYTRPVPEMPERIARQAVLTARAIQTRQGPTSSR